MVAFYWSNLPTWPTNLDSEVLEVKTDDRKEDELRIKPNDLNLEGKSFAVYIIGTTEDENKI